MSPALLLVRRRPGARYHRAMPINSESVAESAALEFVRRWKGVAASELSTAQSFVTDLCALLGVERPHPTVDQDYMYERPITFVHGDGTTSPGRIDCYRRGCFVLEAKKLRTGAQARGYDDALLRARTQAESYARALPSAEGRPPFLIVVDVGNVIELYAEFSRTGATYTPFPDPRSHRHALEDLLQDDVRQLLRAVWTDPDSLNPATRSARVTREVSTQLAELAKSLELAGNLPEHVAGFLTRCLFSMFAEDVELLPKGSFLQLLEAHRNDPATLMQMLRVLWADMDRGGFSAALAHDVLRFNGKLFKEPSATGYALLLDEGQIEALISAARCIWREVEPAIFGTLLERALDPQERQALGAHYTPRAFVERLVVPTVIEPLRAEWAFAQAAAVVLAGEGKIVAAREQVRQFHHHLCTVRVLDPACGSGNFLYVTLEHLKRLEGEVLNQLAAFGEQQDRLALEGQTVTLQQLRGIELNERAAALAELVLWIGFLQWQIRTRGNKAVAEPVVHDYQNIECRDAVLEWDSVEPARGPDGEALTRWDRRTYRTHPVTQERVPDESAQVAQLVYRGARPAAWPAADFIVGNPPFIGARRIRASLGDAYVEAVRAAYPAVPSTVDFVCYWWHKAAEAVLAGTAQRFGLITTNSIVQTYSRPLLEKYLGEGRGLALCFGIADHPWVQDGAAVRVAMTVGCAADKRARALLGRVVDESGGSEEVQVQLEEVDTIGPSITAEAQETDVVPLIANAGLCFQGVVPAGDGFKLEADDLARLGLDADALPSVVRRYMIGRDLGQLPKQRFIIDFFGMELDAVRMRWPALYQHLLLRVKPERDQNARPVYRDKWWIFAEPRPAMRRALAPLSRFIGTPYTAKHRPFTFVDATYLPDAMIYAIASEDEHVLGVLSSVVHQHWCRHFGGTLEDRPRYNSKVTLLPFPFPDEDTGLTPALRERIGALALRIDSHRKARQAEHPTLTLTGMYNVLGTLREPDAPPLSEAEREIHRMGLLEVLRELHDELDHVVAQAYGLPDDRAQWKGLLKQINARRAREELAGRVRWVRPDLQAQAEAGTGLPVSAAQSALELQEVRPEVAASPTPEPIRWPSELPSQVRAVAMLLADRPSPMRLTDIEASFRGRGQWRRSLPAILATLEAVGKARREGEAWRAG